MENKYTETDEIHNYSTFPEGLKECPFCGNRVSWYLTGKDTPFYKRTITIKCNCGATMKESAYRYDTEWLKKTIAEKWNRRAQI